MSDRKHDSEDIAGLFSAFGGDAGRYREFDNAPKAEEGPKWTLLQQLGVAAQQAPVAVAAPALAPSAPPLPAPVAETASAAVTTPQPVPSPRATVGSTATVPLARNLAEAFAPDPGFAAQPAFAPTVASAPLAAPQPSVGAPAMTPPVFASVARGRAAVPPGPPSVLPAASVGVASIAKAGTPLATLFERLATAPDSAISTQHSLMAHWRQSG
ncbi:MAG: hypothetical protein EOO29_23365 [Comamonadaceae bacterium]|nr:MAG: hypothetical protein EOO29_23365 [Comamonadaceae bacterium]